MRSHRRHQSHFRRTQRPPQRAQFCGRACQLERSKARSPCQQSPRDPGRRCGEELVRYSYVAASNSCVPFLYGGCRGNTNNFRTFQQCRDRCKTGSAVPVTRRPISKVHRTSGGSRQNWQGSRHVSRQGSRQWSHPGFGGSRPSRRNNRIFFAVGPRRGSGRKGSTGIGPRFGRRPRPEVGGLDGKVGNHFDGGNEPEAGVGPRRGIFFPGPISISRPSPPNRRTKSRGACFQTPRQAGWPCSNTTIRYSYIRATNSCVAFEFRGCSSSTNNFGSFSECSSLCRTPVQAVSPRASNRQCRLPWRPGSCRGFGKMMRYFYDYRRGACEMVLYSGCGGNSNRFLTRHSCERTCLLG